MSNWSEKQEAKKEVKEKDKVGVKNLQDSFLIWRKFLSLYYLWDWQ